MPDGKYKSRKARLRALPNGGTAGFAADEPSSGTKGKTPMNVVFVKPRMTLDELYRELGSAGSELPPLGLATLAAFVRGKGHRAVIIDAAALKLSSEETVRRVIAAAP
ncbi:MAG: hypothetical protein AB1742_12505, partial [bacterium]